MERNYVTVTLCKLCAVSHAAPIVNHDYTPSCQICAVPYWANLSTHLYQNRIACILTIMWMHDVIHKIGST